MFKYMVVFLLMLVVISPAIAAGEVPDIGQSVTQQPSLSQTEMSRFLSADAQRMIKDEFAVISQDLQAYQDENFIALDGEMKSAISAAQQQLVLGALGAILLGGAIIALVMFNIAKKYSYEKFLEGQLGNPNFAQGGSEGFEKEGSELGNMYQDAGVQQMQQNDWGYPETNSTIGQDQGQSFASNNSEFSNWQQTPPYNEGWQWDGGKKQ